MKKKAYLYYFDDYEYTMRMKFWQKNIKKISVLFFLFFPGLLFAQENVEKVRVGYYENEVFQEGAETGAIKKGYAYEYYQKLSEYTGWKYDYVYGSFSELYQMLVDGKIDLLAGLAWKKEREGYISYPSKPMGKENYTLLKHSIDSEISTDVQTYNGKKIGVLDSAMVDVLKNFLTSNKIQAYIEIFHSYDNLFEAFDDNKIDILATEGDGTYGKRHAEVLCHFGNTDFFLCVNKKRPDLLNKLDQAQILLDIDEPNYLAALRAKYYHSTVSSRAFSETEKKWMAEHPSLRIGYLDNYLPYSGTDADGNVTGIVKDILSRIAGSLGIASKEITYTGYEGYYEMVHAMELGYVDVVFPVGGGLFYSEENGIYQSTPLVYSSVSLVTSSDLAPLTPFNTVESASAKPVKLKFASNQNNTMQYYYIKTNFPDAKIIPYRSEEECLDAVLCGQVHCTTINGLRSDILKNRRYKKLFVRQLTAPDARCFGVKIGNEGLLKLLNRGINVIGSEYAQNLAYRYTESLYAYKLSDFIKDNIQFIILFLLAAAIVVIIFAFRYASHSRKALSAAESASKAKTIFLDNMSHDIQTPMNAIVGFTSLATLNINRKEKLSDYLKQISVSSQHLLSIINNILDISRFETESVFLNEDEVNLPSLIGDITAIVSQSIREKNLDLSFEKNINNKNIITDKLRLQQVILNILGNAIKFTPYGGKISVTINELEYFGKTSGEPKSLFEIIIKDNGIGMSEGFLDVIFEPFACDQLSVEAKSQGSGLGLAITKRIVNLMGGDIFVSSQEGKGSEFVIKVPFSICTLPLMQKDYDDRDVDFTGKKVLLCEDTETNQIIARDILENAGFVVDLARDGVEALEKMKLSPSEFYDIILMDTRMPNMDGYEATRQIRSLSDKKKAQIPIIAVSSNIYGDDRSKIFECGMNAYLSKPYNIPILLTTLKSLLKNN